MNFLYKKEYKPYHGEQRVITKFALLPVYYEDGNAR